MAAANLTRVSVGTSATLVASWQRAAHPFRVRVRFVSSGADVSLGDDSVTTSTGYRVFSEEAFDLIIPPAECGVEPEIEELYAVASSSVSLSVAIDPS